MSDIEIEEHDVLDNPSLRKIFPDISVIKKEILQYEEELSSTFNESPMLTPVTLDKTLLEEPSLPESIVLDSEVPADCNDSESTSETPVNNKIMSDIEIEEHDVLANPLLRKIFPDISVIKKEILQYEEELSSTLNGSPMLTPVTLDKTLLEEPSFPESIVLDSEAPADCNDSESTSETPVNNKVEIRKRFKTFLDSLADDIIDYTDDTDPIVSGTSDKSVNDNIHSSFSNVSEAVQIPDKTVKHYITNNVFILGSKPSVKQPKVQKEKKQLKVVLQNISTYLNACEQYCKKCFILFPNVESLKDHLSKKHSLKQNITNNHNKIERQSPDIQFKCDICMLSLSTKWNLLRHLKKVHKMKITDNYYKKIYDIKSCRVNKNIKNHELNKNLECHVDRSRSTRTHNCFHCTETFETRNLLIEHLYDVLNPKTNVSNSSLNVEQTDSAGTDTNNLSQESNCNSCSICAKKFISQKLFDEHNILCHLNNETLMRTNKSNCSKKNIVQKSELLSESKTSDSIKKYKCKDVINECNFGVINGKDTGKVCQNLVLQTAELNSIDDTVSNDKQNSRNIDKTFFYQCCVCSQYMTYLKVFICHMSTHNIKVTDAAKTVFEPQCKLCLLKFRNIKFYNNHLKSNHKNICTKKINLNTYAFDSVLFKCSECNIYFLSVNVAKCHSEHNKMAVDWKCLKCERIFKLRDKPLHLKQHLLSENITEYVLCESALGRVLYKCLKCAIHFSEDQYILHYAFCDLQTPNSTYCKVCDILIYKNDMSSHERDHKEKNKQSSDFTFIESDVLNDGNVNAQVNKKKNPRAKLNFELTFCQKCKCFLTDVGLRRKSHIEGRCINLNPRLCHQCGLVLTPKGFCSHQKLHRKVNNLELQTFYFYDIKTQKQILPPMPEYPKCKICEVHFLNKSVIKVHECERIKYINCNICNIKLTDAALKLHINYHNYILTPKTTNKNEAILDNDIPLKKTIESNNLYSVKSLLPAIENVNKQETTIFYNCISCHIRVKTYDEVILHCQQHYDSNQEIKICEQKRMHSWDDKVLLHDFDPFFFRFDNNVWIKHIFAHLSRNEINIILEDSMYKSECRFKMEKIQSSTSKVLLYKCGVCHIYIDTNELYSHASKRCAKGKKYPCTKCGLCFSSSNYLMWHKTESHKRRGTNTLSCNIILYNKVEDQQFTKIMLDSRNKFILYQCRSCEGVVEKLRRENHQCLNTELIKCSSCELLIYRNEFTLHFSKHSLIMNFIPTNMIVVLFSKFGSQDNKLKPSFKGIIYDLTFYKCANCGVCIRSNTYKNQHTCVSKSLKSQCKKCYLTFSNKDLQEHLKLHENNLELDYKDFNSNVISFLPYRREFKTQETNVMNKKNKTERDVNDVENLYAFDKIYKCTCGLHFLDDFNSRKHFYTCNPSIKISKQSCFKCDFLFTPGELFNHLLKHHGDKNVKYKYDIINISEK